MSNQNQQVQNILNLGKIIRNVKFPKIERILDQASRKIFYSESGDGCLGDLASPSFCPIKDLAGENLKMIEDINTGRLIINGMATGFDEFDSLTSGLQNSDLIVISGRTGIGKTAFAHNIATYAALENKIPVAYFSLETSSNQLLLRILSSEAKVDLGKICKGFLGRNNWLKLQTATERISSAPLYVIDKPGIDTQEMQAKARRMKTEKGMGLIVVDNIQLMRAEGFRNTRDREISEITHSLKALAMELKVPVIALSQLNRRADDYPTLHPQMSDLRDSGAIEQDADIILFICRDKVRRRCVYNPDGNITEIVIGKHSNGPIGSFKLAFFDKFLRFENLPRMDTEAEKTAKGASASDEALAAMEAALKSEI